MKVTCPGCGASFEVPETVKTITCPYCGLVFGEKVQEDHYSQRKSKFSMMLTKFYPF